MGSTSDLKYMNEIFTVEDAIRFMAIGYRVVIGNGIIEEIAKEVEATDGNRSETIYAAHRINTQKNRFI